MDFAQILRGMLSEAQGVLTQVQAELTTFDGTNAVAREGLVRAVSDAQEQVAALTSAVNQASGR